MVKRLVAAVAVAGLWAACDFGAAFDSYCAETGQCDGGAASGGAAGGGMAGGGTAGGIAGGSSGGIAGGGSSGGISGGSSAGGTAGGGSAGGLAGGSSAGGTAGGVAGGASAGGMGGAGGGAGGSTAGGVAGGASGGSAGGVADDGGVDAGVDAGWMIGDEVSFSWRRPDGGPFRFDLGPSSTCLDLDLVADAGAGAAFRFPAAFTFTVDVSLSDGGAPFGGATSAFAAASCAGGSAPAFAPDASVARVAFAATRFGPYAVSTTIGGKTWRSPAILAKTSGFFVFPADGGAVVATDAGACAAFDLGAVSRQTYSLGVRRSFLEAAAEASFFVSFSPAAGPWSLVRDCVSRQSAAGLVLPAGSSRARFGVLFRDAGIDPGFLGTIQLMPANGTDLGPPYGGTVHGEPGSRVCIPTSGSPGAECSDSSECCGTGVCDFAAGPQVPMCQ